MKKTIIEWLNNIIKERINVELNLVFEEGNTNSWKILLNNNEKYLRFSYFKNFYKIGLQPNLNCTIWNPWEEGFIEYDSNLILPGYFNKNKKLTHLNQYGISVNFDAIGLIYWCLSRCEEVNSNNELLDKFDRFNTMESHAFKNNYLDRPIVDEWIEFIKCLTKRIFNKIEFNKKSFNIFITHDVDSASRYKFCTKSKLIKQIALNFYQEKSLKNILQAFEIANSKELEISINDPHNTFDWIMDAAEKNSNVSTFNFFGGKTNLRFDANYDLDNPTIRALIKKINGRGHLIGLHPSFNTYLDEEAFMKESKKLKSICKKEGIRQTIWGGRMHYLRWKWPETALLWEKANLNYDSTLSFAHRPGFRCGTSHEYQLFDPVKKNPLNIKERPLIVMECSVISNSYLNLGYSEKALEVILDLKNKCRIMSGNFTILWHNSHFNTQKDKEFFLEAIKI